jgi:hypothetical protein
MLRKDKYCSECGEPYPKRIYCAKCGQDITTPHRCGSGTSASSAARHDCRPRKLHLHAGKFCTKCGKAWPEPKYCTACGKDITPTHSCMFGGDFESVHACPRMFEFDD